MKFLLAKLWKLLSLPKGIQLFFMRLLQDQFLIGVTGVIFNEKDEVLVFKHSYRAHPWSLPGGYLNSGEHPKEGLEREIFEESRLIVSADALLETRTDRNSARLDICYVGAFLGGEFQSTHEVTKYGFFSQDTLPLLRKNQVFLIDKALRRRAREKLLQ